MYQDEKGNFHRTDAEENVLWGMRLLKIGFILLIICFTAYFIESIIELYTGLGHYTIDPTYSFNKIKAYYIMIMFLAIFTTTFTGSIYVLGMGTVFLSRILPEPVKKSLKITGILYLILIPLNLLKIIMIYSIYANSSLVTDISRISRIITNIVYSVKVLEFLMLIVIAMLLAKELKQMNEMERGKNGTVVLPGILVAAFIIWLTGGIMFYVVVDKPDPYDVLEPVLNTAIYLEGIGQILYCAIAVGVFIALLVKANKIVIPPLAVINRSGYY